MFVKKSVKQSELWPSSRHFVPRHVLLTLYRSLILPYISYDIMSLLMYDVHNNLAPDNIKNMFTKLSSFHSYRTRSVTNENYSSIVEQVRASLLYFRCFNLEQYSTFYQNT